MLAIAGKLNDFREKVIVVAVYLPPNYTRPRAEACLDYIADVISEAKRLFDYPLPIVGCDWNQLPVNHVCQEHTDLAEVDHGPTRNGRKIDKFLVNFARSIQISDTLPPLDNGNSRESAHL